MNVIDNKKWCQNCPCRLYNTKGYNLNGVGSPYYGNLIVIPNVDYQAYKESNMNFSTQVEIINDVLHSSTGELEHKIFITPLIRCNEYISCDVNDDIINRCINYTNRDISMYGFTRILLLGSAVDRLLHKTIKHNLDVYFCRKNFVIEVNYSPLVKYTNDDLYVTFKDKLCSWYNEAVNKVYTNKRRCYD